MRAPAIACVLLAVSAAAAAAHWGADYFPNVTLTTQDRTKVRFWDDLLKDRKVVIDFIYTDCDASCPLETAKLAQVQKLLGERMGKDVFFYSITIDPKHDTPSVLRAYAKRYHAGPGWLFLTGATSDIELIRRKLGEWSSTTTQDLSAHKTGLTIGNAATGQWMRDSSTDDPNFIAMIAGDWTSSWQHHHTGAAYSDKALDSIARRGAYLFKTECSACHTIGAGDQIGPDLKGVAAVRDRKWLANFVAAPDKLLAAGDPLARALYKKY
ncbi:MAG TPA: SCO family protein, partial [Gemmatimonadaceae bacterium]